MIPRWLPLGLGAALLLSAPADAEIYWTNEGSASIGRANGDGSGVDQEFITGAAMPRGVAIDASHLYWAHGGAAGNIGRADLDGSGVNQTFLAVGGSPQGVALDASQLYWTHTVSGLGKVGSAAPDGSAANQSFVSTGPSPCGVSADGDKVYFANGGTPGSIGSAHGPFAVNQSFITATDDPCGVAVAGGDIYWTNRAGDAIGRADLDGSDADQTFIAAASPCGVAVDGAHVYWTSPGDDAIGRADLDGTDVDASFITGAQDPCGIAVSPTLETMPAAYAFPRTRMGSRSDIQALFVANTSSSLLDVSGASLVGPDSDDFVKTGDACTVNVTPAGRGCVINVRFDPLDAGTRRARLRITSNASSSPTHMRLTGVGVAGPGTEKCKRKPATIIGTSGADTLKGTGGPDVIASLAGADTIEGRDGDDLICGGAGADRLKGGTGDDRLYGEKGDDELSGGPGSNVERP